MKKLLQLFFVTMLTNISYGQDTITCIRAKGRDLLEIKNQIKYGKPLCIEVEGVNTFLMQSYSTYTPINFDFSNEVFLNLNIDDKELNIYEEQDSNIENNPEFINLIKNLKISDEYKSEITSNNKMINKLLTDSINSSKSQDFITSLLSYNQELNKKIQSLEKESKDLINKNKNLEKEIERIKNIKDKTELFKKEFVVFQKHFLNIDSYTTLKNILLNQIKKDSVFIEDVDNFIKRSKSTFTSIYGSETNYLDKKSLVSEEFLQIENGYINLVQLYEQLNTLNKVNKFNLSGELKDGNNVLKFDKITASFETKYFFEEEMKKAKAINDSLLISANRKKIIDEVYEGIDLYDEIINAKFKTKIISNIIYDDKAEIKPQLKNSKGKTMYEYPEINLTTYGNWKINGSAGYFLNFISDDNYQLRRKIETESSSKTGVSESNNDVLKHSLGGLLHAYYNFKGSIDLGFSVGLSINDNANAGFYLGGSMFFTEKNRLIFSAGVSFINVKKLNTSNLVFNETTKNYDFSNETDTEIKYNDIYQPSFFVGFSYNLFKN